MCWYYTKITKGQSSKQRNEFSTKETWATTIKADLEPISGPRLFGYARRRKDWVGVSSELAQDRPAWSASALGKYKYK